MAGTNAHAGYPFMLPGFKPGLQHSEDLGTPEVAFTPTAFWGPLTTFKSRHHTGAERSKLCEDEVLKVGQNVSCATGIWLHMYLLSTVA